MLRLNQSDIASNWAMVAMEPGMCRKHVLYISIKFNFFNIRLCTLPSLVYLKVLAQLCWNLQPPGNRVQAFELQFQHALKHLWQHLQHHYYCILLSLSSPELWPPWFNLPSWQAAHQTYYPFLLILSKFKSLYFCLCNVIHAACIYTVYTYYMPYVYISAHTHADRRINVQQFMSKFVHLLYTTYMCVCFTIQCIYVCVVYNL